MKRLAQQLTEDNLIIKNYIICPSSQNFATHKLFELSEEFCQEIADRTDQGQRYELSSRYIYSCNGVDNVNGIRFGRAQGAVMRAIGNHFGDVRYLKIIKIQEHEKDNSVPETTLETIH